jgi:hypothetical protein
LIERAGLCSGPLFSVYETAKAEVAEAELLPSTARTAALYVPLLTRRPDESFRSQLTLRAPAGRLAPESRVRTSSPLPLRISMVTCAASEIDVEIVPDLVTGVGFTRGAATVSGGGEGGGAGAGGVVKVLERKSFRPGTSAAGGMSRFICGPACAVGEPSSYR